MSDEKFQPFVNVIEKWYFVYYQKWYNALW